MVKYYLTYTGIDRAVYLFEIFEDGFDGESIEIHGYVNHDYATRKDLLEALIASSLDINLEADENLTLQDLYTEEESKFKVQLKRNEQIIFYGILKPDGIWEDFVSNRWEISMDAMDGLSILKDLSFVKDNGTFYEGKITQFEALKQCLKRIGYELPINISKDLPVYDGFIGTDSILKSVLMNADRFYQDKKTDAIMDCEEVLKSILEPYNASIIQMNGEWWIYRSINVKDTMNFYRYDGEIKTDIVWNAELNIGSHTHDFPIFHIGANQKKSINPSTQAFRVNYKYGTVKSLVTNPELIMGNGLYSDGWYFEPFGGSVVRQPEGKGVMIINQIDETPDLLWVYNTDPIEVKINDTINVTFNITTSISLYQPNILTYSFETENYVLTESGWTPKPIGFAFARTYAINTLANVDETFNLPPFLEDGNLIVKIWIRQVFVWEGKYPLKLNSINVTPSSSVNYKGEFHTAQRSTRISSVTKNDKTVSVGDSLSDIYLGTLYKLGGGSTNFWNRSGIIESKTLLQLMVEDSLRIAPRPMYFFEGDVCGYFPYLSKVLINNVSGKYQVSKYSFDTKSNINRTSFKEFSTDLLPPESFTYEFAYDYGQETKVLINP